MTIRRCYRCSSPPRSAFAGFRFPPEVIVLSVRWYTCGMASRTATSRSSSSSAVSSEVDHVTVSRWVQRFTPLRIDAARACRHAVGDRWYVDETYVKVAGLWLYRAVDQYGQVIDVYASPRRDTNAARHFFTTALGGHATPAEVVTDRAWTLRAVADELMPGVFHNTEQYANNRIETITAGSRHGFGHCEA